MNVKALGIVRKLDELHRLVVPRELCRVMGLKPGTPMEFFVKDGAIFIKPYIPQGNPCPCCGKIVH